MEKIMAQSQTTKRTETSGASEGTFTNKPTVLADNGHGTKVKLWPSDGPGQQGIPNVAIERSFKRKGSDQWETQKVSINAQDLLAVIRGLEEGHDAIVEKQIGKQQGQTAKSPRMELVRAGCRATGGPFSSAPYLSASVLELTACQMTIPPFPPCRKGLPAAFVRSKQRFRRWSIRPTKKL